MLGRYTKRMRMPYRSLGRTPLKVSALGLCPQDLGVLSAGETCADALMSAALDAGVNLFETHAGPIAEERLGRFLRGRRNQVVLSIRARGLEEGTAVEIERSLSASLRRMQTDWIDIMHLHGPLFDERRAAAWLDVLVAARSAGKIRAIAWSDGGFAVGSLPSDPRIDVLQARLSSRHPALIREAVHCAVERGVGVLARFSGRSAPPGPSLPEPAAIRRPELWLRHAADLPGVASIVVRASRPAELERCLRWISRGRLSPEVLAELEQGPGVSDSLKPQARVA
jgi:aryl-alcohol dehydrogenase-like predicted oxidoreductase